MTRKHFDALAAALLNSKQAVQDGIQLCKNPEGAIAYTAFEVADVCARFNQNFDRARFLKACGVEESK